MRTEQHVAMISAAVSVTCAGEQETRGRSLQGGVNDSSLGDLQLHQEEYRWGRMCMRYRCELEWSQQGPRRLRSGRAEKADDELRGAFRY